MEYWQQRQQQQGPLSERVRNAPWWQRPALSVVEDVEHGGRSLVELSALLRALPHRLVTDTAAVLGGAGRYAANLQSTPGGPTAREVGLLGSVQEAYDEASSRLPGPLRAWEERAELAGERLGLAGVIAEVALPPSLGKTGTAARAVRRTKLRNPADVPVRAVLLDQAGDVVAELKNTEGMATHPALARIFFGYEGPLNRTEWQRAFRDLKTGEVISPNEARLRYGMDEMGAFMLEEEELTGVAAARAMGSNEPDMDIVLNAAEGRPTRRPLNTREKTMLREMRLEQWRKDQAAEAAASVSEEWPLPPSSATSELPPSSTGLNQLAATEAAAEQRRLRAISRMVQDDEEIGGILKAQTAARVDDLVDQGEQPLAAAALIEAEGRPYVGMSHADAVEAAERAGTNIDQAVDLRGDMFIDETGLIYDRAGFRESFPTGQDAPRPVGGGGREFAIAEDYIFQPGKIVEQASQNEFRRLEEQYAKAFSSPDPSVREHALQQLQMRYAQEQRFPPGPYGRQFSLPRYNTQVKMSPQVIERRKGAMANAEAHRDDVKRYIELGTEVGGEKWYDSMQSLRAIAHNQLGPEEGEKAMRALAATMAIASSRSPIIPSAQRGIYEMQRIAQGVRRGPLPENIGRIEGHGASRMKYDTQLRRLEAAMARGEDPLSAVGLSGTGKTPSYGHNLAGNAFPLTGDAHFFGVFDVNPEKETYDIYEDLVRQIDIDEFGLNPMQAQAAMWVGSGIAGKRNVSDTRKVFDIIHEIAEGASRKLGIGTERVYELIFQGELPLDALPTRIGR